MVIHVRSRPKAPLRSNINVGGGVELIIDEEAIGVEQERPKAAAVAGNEGEVARVRSQAARVVREVEHRNARDVERRAPRLDPLTRNDLQVFRADADGRPGEVVGGDEAIGGGIDVVGPLAMQALAGGKDRGPAGAELDRFHLLGLEVVADMLADPELVHVLDANLTVGSDVSRLLVHAHFVSRQESSAIPDEHAVGAIAQPRVEIERRPALIRQRFHLPKRLLLRLERPRDRQGAQDDRKHQAQSCHSACRANQNPGAVPSDISGRCRDAWPRAADCAPCLPRPHRFGRSPLTIASSQLYCAKPRPLARELQALFQEQVYGCQSEHAKAVTGNPGLCPHGQPAASSAPSSPGPDADARLRRAAQLPPSKTQHRDQPAGPAGHSASGEDRPCEARSSGCSHIPVALSAVSRRAKRADAAPVDAPSTRFQDILYPTLP